MKTIIPIRVEDVSTETLEKITELMVGKFNRKMKIDLYHDRRRDYRSDGAPTSTISHEIQAIMDLIGKSGQPYYVISSQPNT